jgi:hypothetical protein
MPSSHNLSSQVARDEFLAEWKEAIDATRSYPCVVQWILFNENWGDPGPFQDAVVLATRYKDGTRPITDTSGGNQRDRTDVIDVHDYSNSLSRQGVAHLEKPKVVGEYGGITLHTPGQTETTGEANQIVQSVADLLARIRYQTTQLFEAANLSGFVYTQLTDVEQELNGLMTYDRQPKADAKRLAAIFTGKDRTPHSASLRDGIVLGSIRAVSALTTADDSPENRVATTSSSPSRRP